MEKSKTQSVAAGKSIREFLPIYLGVGILAAVLGGFLLILFGWHNKLNALFWAWLVSALVILIGYLANQWAFLRSHKVFLGVLLGGMVGRILIIVSLIYLIYVNQWLPVVWFLVFLAIYYFLFQSVEIWIINRQLKRQGLKRA